MSRLAEKSSNVKPNARARESLSSDKSVENGLPPNRTGGFSEKAFKRGNTTQLLKWILASLPLVLWFSKDYVWGRQLASNSDSRDLLEIRSHFQQVRVRMLM